MAKYKIGDKVRIRDDLKYGEWYYMHAFGESQMVNEDMIEKTGQIVTIKDFDTSGCYYIEEDCWHWTDEMFSERAEEVTRKFKVGDVVRFRSDLFTGMSIFSEEGKSLGILSSMSNYAGQEATITDVTGPTYSVDTNRFCWYVGAFEDKTIDKSIYDEEKEIKTKLPFKAGDKVLVREDLEKGEFYTNVSTSDYDVVTEFMLDLRGKVCTIERILGDKYKLIEDDHGHSWTEEMFVLDEYPSKKANGQSKEEKKEDKPSLFEYQVEHQHDIPKRLFYLAKKYPNVTWKKAKAYYARVVDSVILGTGEENLFSGSLSFGRGLSDAAARFEELLKLEEKAVSLKSTVGTIATFEGIPVFEGEIPNPVSDDKRTSKKIDCFSCTSADCANCENFKYKMAIT